MDFERHLGRLDSTKFLSQIVQSVLRPLHKAQPGLEWEDFIFPDVQTLRVRVGEISFDFVFWLRGRERFSFFIADREVIDEFLEYQNQAEELAACLYKILSSPVTIVEHTRDSDGLALKREYQYTLLRPDRDESVTETVTLVRSKLKAGDRVRRNSKTVVPMQPRQSSWT